MENKELLEKFGNLVAEFKKLNDEIAAGKKDKAEYKEVLEKMQVRLDDYEVKLNRTETETREKEELGEFEVKDKTAREAYNTFLRKGEAGMTPEHQKSLISGDDNQGGFFVPEERTNQVVEFIRETSPIRGVVNVITISTDEFVMPAEDSSQDYAANWVGEVDARAETDAGKTSIIKIPVHELYANPRASQRFLDDSAVAPEAWINRKLAERFSITENTAFVSGDGVAKPEGILEATLTSVASGDANLLTADGLINLRYSPKTPYGDAGTWLFRRSSMSAIRKLKGSDNNYLWQPGLQGGVPSMILDRPFILAEDVPAVAAGAKAVIFGDLRRGYTIVDRIGLRMIRDPFSNKPFVEFYTTKRVGGQTVLAEAIHIITIGA